MCRCVFHPSLLKDYIFFSEVICRHAFYRKALAMVEPKPTNQPTNIWFSDRPSFRIAWTSWSVQKANKLGKLSGRFSPRFHHRNDTGNQPAKVDGIVQKLGNLTQQVGGGVGHFEGNRRMNKKDKFFPCLMSFPFDRCGLSNFVCVSTLAYLFRRWRPCVPAEAAVLVKVCLWSWRRPSCVWKIFKHRWWPSTWMDVWNDLEEGELWLTSL